MTERRVGLWVWGLFAVGVVGGWWPLLDARVQAAAQHSSDLPSPHAWRDFAAELPPAVSPEVPLFVRSSTSAEFIWLRFLAYPQRMTELPRRLERASLQRVLPTERAWLLLLHTPDHERAVRQLGVRLAPRVPVLRARDAEHLLVELPP